MGKMQNMVAEVTRKLGRIDVLVNNAGVMNPRGPLWELDPLEWDQMMNINFRAPFLTCRHIVPVMILQGRGSIINIGSGAGISNRAEASAYCSSKAALHSLSQCLAKEVKEHNIAVTCPR